MIPPNHVDYFSKIVHAIISQQVIVDCFGGGEGSSTALSLLLGKVSHTRKTTPMLQLEEILEIPRHVSPDHADLSGADAQELWLKDTTTSLVDPERILESFSTKVVAILAFALIQPCIEARDAGADIFGLNLSYTRCLLFLAPSGRGTLWHLQKLFELAPFGDLKVDSATQSLLNSGEWTTTEIYADMLEHYLCYFEKTIKGMAQSDEGWASQPVIPTIKNATLETLAFYIKSITTTLSTRKGVLPRKRKRGDEDHESPAGVGSMEANNGTLAIRIPTPAEMLTRSRKPVRRRTSGLLHLPGPASTTAGSAADGDRTGVMTSADCERALREFANSYSNKEGTSALSAVMQKAIIEGRGDDTRYNKRLKGPAPGAKAHFRTEVCKRCRALGIALSHKQIDFMIQRRLSRVNFNLFQLYSASLKLEEKQKKQKQQLPAQGYATLRWQFKWFQELFGLIVGPTEAAAIVGFWKRELDTMRVEEFVDWNTAYTLWRNMLVDYEVRWSEWDPQLYLPPTMWDWEDHTQEVYNSGRTLARLLLDRNHKPDWDVRPNIIAKVSASEAATADPEDTDISAFVPMPFLPCAARKAKTTKSKRERERKTKRTRARKAAVDTDSEEGEESESEADDGDRFGKPCRDNHGRILKRCNDCKFFSKFGVCRNYHADAPAGTTGAKGRLNKKSLKKLTKMRAFNKGRRRR